MWVITLGSYIYRYYCDKMYTFLGKVFDFHKIPLQLSFSNSNSKLRDRLIEEGMRANISKSKTVLGILS